MAKFHILSLDGGGIRGVLTARLLERIQEQLPWFMDSIDMIAGTSTGGILALALAAGKTPLEVRKMYESMGNEVFQNGPFEIRELANLMSADYSNQPLRQAIGDVVKDKTLGDLKTKVMITTFDLDNEVSQPYHPRTWKAKFFHNFPEPKKPSDDRSQKAIDVAIRTSAAPTFFPIYQGFVDGGVVANNPSMCAIAQAIHEETGGQSLGNIAILSIGTGNFPHYMTETNETWGLVQWAPHLISLMMEGSSGLADYQASQLLGKRYYRLNPILQKNIGLDQVKELDYLVDIANLEVLDPVIAWLKKNFRPPAAK
jgi:patatin-like phospholipase/acyl hydrolase